MSRQAVIVMAIGAVIAAAAVAVRLGSGGTEPAVAVAPPPPRDTSAPVPSNPKPVAEAPARRPPAKAPAPAAPVTPAEPAAPEAPATATLRITSDVPDAQVFIDRKFIGSAPAVADNIAPGSHQINVSAPGYEGVAETVDVIPGPRDILISLKTIRLSESVAVKHKHRFGSCAGTLRATPEGLRYETDNTSDGFFVPLTELEIFTMDFVSKSLKVKIRKGKTYDFIDPGDTPDPLYYFHQAVDKVRARVAKGTDARVSRGPR